MKRRVLFIILAVLVLGLSSCGQSQDGKTPSEGDSADGAIALGKPFVVEGFAEITIEEVDVTDEVVPPNATGVYSLFTCDDPEKTFVNLIMNVKNLSSAAVSMDELFYVSMEVGTAKYLSTFTARLIDDDSNLDSYSSLEPLAKSKVYCGIMVPKSVLGESTIIVSINNQKYTLQCSTKESTIKRREMTVGNVVTAENYGEITLIGAEYKDSVLPPKASGYYTYYEADSGNVFLDLVISVKNLKSMPKNGDEFFGATLIYKDQYKYKGFAMAESSDGTDLDSFVYIDPLQTKVIHQIIEVPEEVESGTSEVELYFGGEYYFIKVK